MLSGIHMHVANVYNFHNEDKLDLFISKEN